MQPSRCSPQIADCIEEAAGDDPEHSQDLRRERAERHADGAQHQRRRAQERDPDEAAGNSKRAGHNRVPETQPHQRGELQRQGQRIESHIDLQQRYKRSSLLFGL